MTGTFEIRLPPERAYRRNGLFAVELLDPLTLERVTDGISVKADGLVAAPRVNSSGLFVWTGTDASAVTGLSIDPKLRPYDPVTLTRADLTLPPSPSPVTTIELPPRVDYFVAAGTTAARGTLVVDPGTPATPVQGALVHLRWLDDDGITWHDARPVSRTNANGDFIAILRLAPSDLPHLDSAGRVTVRLHVTRESDRRQSVDIKLPPGRVADPSTLNALIVAWNDLQP